MPGRPKANVELIHHIKFKLNNQDVFYVGGSGSEEKDWSPDFADAKLFKDFTKATVICEKVSPNAAIVALNMGMARNRSRKGK
jgi:hypothetical protein